MRRRATEYSYDGLGNRVSVNGKAFTVDMTRQFNNLLNDSTQNFVYDGFGILNVEINGEKAYFWYYEDLKTDKSLSFKDVRKYSEGELIITMD